MATSGNLVSVKLIADRLMRNPLMKDLTWEFIVDNAVEVLRILEAPSLFVNKTEVLQVKGMRALKPLDVLRINGIFHGRGSDLTRLRPSEDMLHGETDNRRNPLSQTGDGTYSVNSRFIVVNFKEGEIVISYKSLATDDECYPMIIDNAILLRCIESYIKWKWFDILNDMDIISDRKLNKAETDYCFNVAQADVSLKMPSDDEMESLVNQITQILPSSSEYQSRFQYLGTRERMRIQ